MYRHCFGNGFDICYVNLIFLSFGFVIGFDICIGFGIFWLTKLCMLEKH